jgi:hypothetical protein
MTTCSGARAPASDAVSHGDRVFIYYPASDPPRGRRPLRAIGSFMKPSLSDQWSRRVPVVSVRLGAERLLARCIAARTTSVTSILDACCSAGATRGDLTLQTSPHATCPPRRVRARCAQACPKTWASEGRSPASVCSVQPVTG